MTDWSNYLSRKGTPGYNYCLHECCCNICPCGDYFPQEKCHQPSGQGSPSRNSLHVSIVWWINSSVFCESVDHFIYSVKPTRSDPVVLVLDWHYSHTRSTDLLDKARANYINIICIPHLQRTNYSLLTKHSWESWSTIRVKRWERFLVLMAGQCHTLRHFWAVWRSIFKSANGRKWCEWISSIPWHRFLPNRWGGNSPNGIRNRKSRAIGRF